jgi:hypothetical protein
MNSDNSILVKTFGNMSDADLAVAQLRSAGIECFVTSDDCAGMYPSMGVIELRVSAEHAADARQILNEPAGPA